MRSAMLALAVGAAVSASGSWASAAEGEKAIANPLIVIKTSEGTIKVELWADKAPGTVKNFLRYADEKFYDGTVFHRVIANFMIQGGGMTADLRRKATHDPIKNEAKADLKNARGTIAMARTGEVDSATSQFFINVNDNKSLNYAPGNPGYTVLGKVIAGMDVANKIAKSATGKGGPFPQDVPVEKVIIKSVRVITP